MGEALGERMARPGEGLLLGRRSYEELLSHWNSVENSPFTPALNNARKYVAASDASAQLEWPNSTLLSGDVPAEVAMLKHNTDGDLMIMGSGVLIHSLLPYGLIDEYTLLIYPLVLGSGVRLFSDDGVVARLRLVDSRTTTTGVIIATYHMT
jgi:dihydrofolate reductase